MYDDDDDDRRWNKVLKFIWIGNNKIKWAKIAKLTLAIVWFGWMEIWLFGQIWSSYSLVAIISKKRKNQIY